MIVAFDIDNCLIDRDKKPIKANVELLKVLSKEHKIICWSGNGHVYAINIINKMGLSNYIVGVLDKYGTFRPDIAFDDQEIDLGKVNIKV